MSARKHRMTVTVDRALVEVANEAVASAAELVAQQREDRRTSIAISQFELRSV